MQSATGWSVAGAATRCYGMMASLGARRPSPLTVIAAVAVLASSCTYVAPTVSSLSTPSKCMDLVESCQVAINSKSKSQDAVKHLLSNTLCILVENILHGEPDGCMLSHKCCCCEEEFVKKLNYDLSNSQVGIYAEDKCKENILQCPDIDCSICDDHADVCSETPQIDHTDHLKTFCNGTENLERCEAEMFACQDGFVASGFAECVSGVWDVTNARCLKPCDHNPDWIEHLDEKKSRCGGTRSGDDCKFICADGFSASGTVTCTDGLWETSSLFSDRAACNVEDWCTHKRVPQLLHYPRYEQVFRTEEIVIDEDVVPVTIGFSHHRNVKTITLDLGFDIWCPERVNRSNWLIDSVSEDEFQILKLEYGRLQVTRVDQVDGWHLKLVIPCKRSQSSKGAKYALPNITLKRRGHICDTSDNTLAMRMPAQHFTLQRCAAACTHRLDPERHTYFSGSAFPNPGPEWWEDFMPQSFSFAPGRLCDGYLCQCWCYRMQSNDCDTTTEFHSSWGQYDFIFHSKYTTLPSPPKHDGLLVRPEFRTNYLDLELASYPFDVKASLTLRADNGEECADLEHRAPYKCMWSHVGAVSGTIKDCQRACLQQPWCGGVQHDGGNKCEFIVNTVNKKCDVAASYVHPGNWHIQSRSCFEDSEPVRCMEISSKSTDTCSEALTKQECKQFPRNSYHSRDGGFEVYHPEMPYGCQFYTDPLATKVEGQKSALLRCCPKNMTTDISICSGQILTDVDRQCAEGYKGPLCGGCKENYVGILHSCVPCDGGTSFSESLAVVIGVFVLYCGTVALTLTHCATIRVVKSKSGGRVLSQIKILILFGQLLSSLPSAFDAVPWPPVFKSFAIYIGVPFTLDFIPVLGFGSCRLALGPLDAFLLHMMVVPLVVLAVYLAHLLTTKMQLCYICIRVKSNESERAFIRKLRLEFAIKITIFSVQLLYPGLASRVFGVYRCRQFKWNSDSEALLSKNLLVHCHVGRHALFEALAALFLILYVIGVPCIIFLLLWFNRKDLNDEDSPRHESVKFKFGALYQQFEPKAWWFEILIILMKCLMTGALSVIAPGSPVQLLLATIIMLLFTLATLRIAPYRRDVDDTLSFIVSLSMTFNTLIGLVLIMEGQEHSVNIVALEAVLFVVNLSVLVIQVFVIVLMKWGLWEICVRRLVCLSNYSSKNSNNMKVVPVAETKGKTTTRNRTEAKVQSNTLEMQKDNVLQLMTSFDNSERRLIRQQSHRQQRHSIMVQQRVAARRKVRQSKALSKTTLFAELDSVGVDAVLKAMVYETFKQNETICEQGAVADRFYVIVSGRCVVTVTSPTIQNGIQIGELKTFDFFGENALMDDGPSAKRKRSATVRAEGGDVQTLSLDRPAFFRLLELEIIGEGVLERMRLVQEERTNLSDERLRAVVECRREAPTPPLGIPPVLASD